MKTKTIHATSAVALCITLVSPTLATAASASLTLSNINVTSGIGISWDKVAIANWMNSYNSHPGCDPVFCGFPAPPPDARDNVFLQADMMSQAQYQSGESQMYFDQGVVVNSGDTHSISSNVIPGANSNGLITTGLHTQHVDQYANVSPDLAKSSYFTSSRVYIASEEYFRHSGSASEIHISADYSLFADSGDNSVPGNAYVDIKFTTNFNGVYSVVFDRMFNFSSATDPGAHSDSGTLSINLIVPNWVSDGKIAWEINSSASLTPGFTIPGGIPLLPIPEPQTYAMLLVGLGLMGFVGRRLRLS